jgi:hypothetical protein
MALCHLESRTPRLQYDPKMTEKKRGGRTIPGRALCSIHFGRRIKGMQMLKFEVLVYRGFGSKRQWLT